MADDVLDNALDRSLAQYAAVEPLAGLEQRILRRLSVERDVRAKRTSRWALVLTCSTALTAQAVFTFVHYQVAPGQSDVVITLAPPPLPLVLPQQRFSLPPAFPQVSIKKAAGTVLPKRTQFLGTAPMTAEETALVSLVTQAPKEAVQQLSNWTQQPIVPIAVEPVRVEPLKTDEPTEGAKRYVE
jgi:hypothetical protein